MIMDGNNPTDGVLMNEPWSRDQLLVVRSQFRHLPMTTTVNYFLFLYFGFLDWLVLSESAFLCGG